MRQSRPSAPRPASADAARERPAPPVFRTFVRTLEKLEGTRGQAPRPAREGAR
ncbi:MAG TPA: hypothetical protein VF744_10700 [Beijerinckiaceae bacterium]|jgi:hypothetical protein